MANITKLALEAALKKELLTKVMEPLCDRQRNDTAALSLAASSLYFTVLANGNSRFFFEADQIGRASCRERV